jgi:hypothetical protein
VEMPGLWKAWKAKSRLPTLSTSPLEISPTPGEIPTFPQRRRRRRWKSGKPKAGFPLSHRPEDILGKPTKSQGGRASPPARQRRPNINERRLVPATWTSPFSDSRRIGIEPPFQAHGVLESILDFRLICGLEYADLPSESGRDLAPAGPAALGVHHQTDDNKVS